MRSPVENIIIGGGVSGLACAGELHRQGKQFLLITENIGRRVLPSRNNGVNYGAYYMMKDYEHISSIVERGRRLRPNFFLSPSRSQA